MKVNFEVKHKFEVGKSYYYTFATCEEGTAYGVKIIRRTEKSVWFTFDNDPLEIHQKKVYVYGDTEEFLPHGSYSMAPVVTAQKTWNDEPAAVQEQEPAATPAAVDFESDEVKAAAREIVAAVGKISADVLKFAVERGIFQTAYTGEISPVAAAENAFKQYFNQAANRTDRITTDSNIIQFRRSV